MKSLIRFICALFLLCGLARGAEIITSTVVFTNAANLTNAVAISNALIIANTDTRKFTNSISTPATQILIKTNIGTNIAQQVQQLLSHVSTYPFSGLTPSGDAISFVRFRGTNDQAVSVTLHPNTWGFVTNSTQTVGTAASVVRMPIEVETSTNRTKIATELFDAINKYSTNRIYTNLTIGPVNLTSLQVTGLFTTLGGQRIAVTGITNNLTLTTNHYWISVTPTSGPVKITLPTAASSSNQTWVVADGWGAASTNKITITNAGTDQIRGALSMGISNNFGAIILLSKGGTNFDAIAIGIDPTIGEANTAANLGGSFNTFDSKSGVSLRFNTFTNGAGLSGSSNNNVITWSVVNDGITDAMLRNSAAVSVIGRSANSSGDPADIAAGANYRILTRESDSLAFRQITLNNYLSDIAAAFPSLANGDVLMYDSSSGKWTNAVPPGAGGGEANTGSNLGSGWPTYDSKSGVALRFNTWTNGVGLVSASNANTLTVSLANAIKIDSILTTNVQGRLRSLVTSVNTTNQIDWASGPEALYWTNMVTNVVLQLTNVWTAGVTNRSLDLFFTGATNTGPNFTVTLSCPNPAGVNFRWGWNSVTNGNSDLTVTNNQRAGLVLTMWETNLVEAYWSPVR